MGFFLEGHSPDWEAAATNNSKGGSDAHEEKYFTVRLVKHWQSLPGEVLGHPSLEVSWTQQDKPGVPALSLWLALL